MYLAYGISSSYSRESFLSTVKELNEYSPELISSIHQVDRILFTHPQTNLAYSWESPAPICSNPPLNMTAANLHLPALGIIDENIKKKHKEGAAGRNLRALDVGTGLGYIATVLKHLSPGIYVKGIDVIPELIERSKEINTSNFPLHNIDFELKNIEDFANDYNSIGGNDGKGFDIIHGGATAQKSQIQTILDLLNEGGVMIFPYKTDYFWMEELAYWTKDEKGNITGPISIAPVMYTPLVRSKTASSESEENIETG